MGSSGHVEKDAFGLDVTELPYQHTVTTKRSQNRRSTQRHTFFMMGGGSANDMKPTSVSTIHDEELDDGYDSGTAVTEANDEYLSYNRKEDDSMHQAEQHTEHHDEMDDSSSIPVSPASIQKPPVAWQPPEVIQQNEPVVLPSQTPTSLPPPVKQRERPTRSTPDHAALHGISLQQHAQNDTTVSPSMIEMYQPTHSAVTFPTTTQDYTSITAVNTGHSSDSMSHAQQQQPRKQPKRSCCCIIS
ncbi:unnamed protein product [Mucor circinelloides]